ncbi:hypothetical protein ACHAXT_004980 [Thalassiosira profunda]
MDRAKGLCARAADRFHCRLAPHGGAVLLPIVLSTLALAASLADDGCDYARLTGPAVEILAGSSAVPFVDCGMDAYRVPGFYPAENAWRVAYADECRPYQSMHVLADAPWMAAEWLKFFGVVAGGTTAAFLWTAVCLALRPRYWGAAGAGAFVACLCQMGSFVWFYTRLCHTSATNVLDFEAGREVELASNAGVTSECRLFFGSKCAIASCILWAAAAGVILLREYPVPAPKLIVHDDENASIKAPGRAGHSATSGRRSSAARLHRSNDNNNGVTKSGTSTSLTASMSTTGQSFRGSNRSLWVSDALGAGMGDSNRISVQTSMRTAGGNSMEFRPTATMRPAELSVSAISYA